MDQFENQSQELTPELKSFINGYNEYFKEFKTYQSNTAVLLIGKTRVGKSTIFHILKGDELETNNKGQLVVNKSNECLIGLTNKSQTRTPNIYRYRFKNKDDYDEQVDIIDTPGFDDNNNKQDDAIAQIQLLTILKMYRKVIFLLVTKYDQYDSSSYARTLNFAQNLFKQKQDIISIMKNRGICLIANLIDQQELESLKGNLEDEIKSNDINNLNKTYPLEKEFLQKIKENVIQLERKADKHHQQQFKTYIYNFVEQDRKTNEIVNFKLSITNDGKQFIQGILTKIREICQSEIYKSIEIFIAETKKVNDLKAKKQQLLQFSQLFDEQFQLEDVLDLNYQNFKEFFKELGFKLCISKKLNELEFLFTQNIIQNILINLRETYKDDKFSIIQLTNAKKKIWDEIQKIQEEILAQINFNQRDELIVNNLQSCIEEFTKFQNWNRLFIFIGNPLCGKSSTINFLYKLNYKENNSSSMKLHYYAIQNENVIQFCQVKNDLILEFQLFSDDYVLLLQYFIFLCQSNNKECYIQIVYNKESLNENIESGLQTFCLLNSIKRDDASLNQLPSILHKSFDIRKTYIMDLQNLKCFPEIASQEWNQEVLNMVFLSFNRKFNAIIELFHYNICQNIKNHEFFQDEKQNQKLQFLLQLAKLNPEQDKSQFQQDIFDLINLLNQLDTTLNITVEDNENGNYQRVKNLFKTLINDHEIGNTVNQVFEDTQQIFHHFNKAYQKYQNLENIKLIDIFNLITEFQENFQFLLSQQEIEVVNSLKPIYMIFQYKIQQSEQQKIFYQQKLLFDIFKPTIIHQNFPQYQFNELIQELFAFGSELLESIEQLNNLISFIELSQEQGYESQDYYFPLNLIHLCFSKLNTFNIESEKEKKQKESINFICQKLNLEFNDLNESQMKSQQNLKKLTQKHNLKQQEQIPIIPFLYQNKNKIPQKSDYNFFETQISFKKTIKHLQDLYYSKSQQAELEYFQNTLEFYD